MKSVDSNISLVDPQDVFGSLLNDDDTQKGRLWKEKEQEMEKEKSFGRTDYVTGSGMQ